MDSIQFIGHVANVSAKWGTGAVTVKLLCKLKNIVESDRDKLGLWARAEEPKVDLVIALSQAEITIELNEGELAGAKVDLASQKLAVSIVFKKDDFDQKAESTLTALLRFPQVCQIEIKNGQYSFSIGG